MGRGLKLSEVERDIILTFRAYVDYVNARRKADKRRDDPRGEEDAYLELWTCGAARLRVEAVDEWKAHPKTLAVILNASEGVEKIKAAADRLKTPDYE